MKKYITNLNEIINIIGKDNAILPDDVAKLGFLAYDLPIKIPKEVLKWDKQIIEKRKLVNKELVINYINRYNVKSIYTKKFTIDFFNKKFYQIWKKTWKKKYKLYEWNIKNKEFNNTNKVWVHYDEIIDECPYILFPGIEMNICDMLYEFYGLICDKNKPLDKSCRADLEELNQDSIKAINRKVKPGWYLMLKNPERNRFINKSRKKQIAKLKNYEKWGKLAESVLGTILAKVILKQNICTDYVHTNDFLYKNEGKWTYMFRNIKTRIIISYNCEFHGHRNTVLSVVIPVSNEEKL